MGWWRGFVKEWGRQQKGENRTGKRLREQLRGGLLSDTLLALHLLIRSH